MSLRGQRVDLRVEVDPTWRATDRIQVYTDRGTGTVDANVGLLRAPQRIFPDDQRDGVAHLGYGEEPYGKVPYSHERGVTGRDHGYGQDRYGEVGYGETVRVVIVAVDIPQAYGNWKFAAEAVDGAGNVQGALVEFTQFVSGEDPPPLASFAFSSYNGGSDKVLFSFTL